RLRPSCPTRRSSDLIGFCDQALNSHFSQLGHDAGLKLVAMASRWYLDRALAGTPWRDLPILAAVAPFRTGGRGGPVQYTNIRPRSEEHTSELQSRFD